MIKLLLAIATGIYAASAAVLPLLADDNVISIHVASIIGVAMAAFATAVHLPIAVATASQSTPVKAGDHEA